MSVYNDEKYLEEAILSILNQTYRGFEFIIINDGSTDSSQMIIEKYVELDNRIVFVNQKNIGLTKSLNRAIGLSKGKYIARMDSDDISLNTRFEKQVDFLEKNQKYALVGTNIIKIDTQGKELEVNKTQYSHMDIVKTFKIRNCIAHGSVMVNKELLQDNFLYDETFLYAQDYKLWASIAKKYQVKNLEEPLYKLRLHSESISKQKIEKQSIYAGIVAYEFETDKKLNNLDSEIILNQSLRKKIAIILLMNFELKLARKYLSRWHFLYYGTYFFELIDLKKFKSYFK